jgi:lactoylglutathione lyase
MPLVSRTDLGTIKEAILQSPHGGSRLQLAQKLDDSSCIEMGNAMWKLYVNTSDCQALDDKALAAGCESVMAPTRLNRWPVTMAYVNNCDGYLNEFVESHEGTQPGRPRPQGRRISQLTSPGNSPLRGAAGGRPLCLRSLWKYFGQYGFNR